MTVWRGTISYVRDATGRQGRDDFTLTRTADGSWVVVARTVTEDTGILRDVVHVLDQHHRPVSSHITQWRDGVRAGDGWLVARPDGVHGDVWLTGQGSVRQHIPSPTWPAFIVPHAVVCDAFICATYDLARGGEQAIDGGVRSSPHADGSTGPLGSLMEDLTLTLLDTDEVTVPAGTFPAEHFLVRSDGGVEEHLWVTPGERLLLRLRSDRLGTTYQLEELLEGPPPSPAARA